MFVSNEAAGNIDQQASNGSRSGVDPESLGSTGKGLGHLSNAHAIGCSEVPLVLHRVKTITTTEESGKKQ